MTSKLTIQFADIMITALTFAAFEQHALHVGASVKKGGLKLFLSWFLQAVLPPYRKKQQTQCSTAQASRMNKKRQGKNTQNIVTLHVPERGATE